MIFKELNLCFVISFVIILPKSFQGELPGSGYEQQYNLVIKKYGTMTKENLKKYIKEAGGVEVDQSNFVNTLFGDKQQLTKEEYVAKVEERMGATSLDKLKEGFKMFFEQADTNHDGQLSFIECKTLVETKVELTIKEDKIRSIVAERHPEGNHNYVDFEDFFAVFTIHFAKKHEEKLIDPNHPVAISGEPSGQQDGASGQKAGASGQKAGATGQKAGAQGQKTKP